MTTGLQASIGDAAEPFAALLLGHVLADFVFQSRRMVERKRGVPGLLAHGVVVYLAHVAAFLPLLDRRAAVLLLGVALVHILVDRFKIAYETRRGPSLAAFLIDQALHLIVLFYVALYLSYGPTGDAPFAFLRHLPSEHAVRLMLYVAGGAFLWTGGSALVRLALLRTRLGAPDGGGPAAGHAIGVLERLIIYVAILAGQWAAAGLVVAAKSLARFEDLKQRPFAEYYLVGTLASVFLAMTTGSAVAALT